MTASWPALSLTQEFLCSLDRGETAGALSQWYTITYGRRLRGPLDVGALSAALDDVVARHEILRTTLDQDDDGWHQQLHPPGPVGLQVRAGPAGAGAQNSARRAGAAAPPPPSGALAGGDQAAYDLLDEVEAEPFSRHEVPLLRAVLLGLGPADHVLALTTHHIASDAWSMQLIITDLGACYAARSAGRAPDLPAARQYREF